jgi:hypothetical protein
MARLALLSTSDKTGLVEFARRLVEFEFELLSSGGTAQTLLDAGIPVIKVSDYTGSPEILAGENAASPDSWRNFGPSHVARRSSRLRGQPDSPDRPGGGESLSV